MPRRRRSQASLSLPTPIVVGLCLTALAVFAWLQFDQQPVLMLVLLAATVAGMLVGSWWVWRQFWNQVARTRALQITDIDQMTGFAFEHYVAELLRSQGYREVEVTKQQGDFGADLLFRDAKGVKWAAQLKRYQGLVGVEAIYQVIGGQKYYDCHRAMVVTNSNFTSAAIELALKSSVYLVYRERLIEWMVEFQQSGARPQ